ncbi:MAG TPA: hypothetical protein VMT44_01185, partial [Methanoregula sp.]|nr:hypothetical protein [Methanoregula sp.]
DTHQHGDGKEDQECFHGPTWGFLELLQDKPETVKRKKGLFFGRFWPGSSEAINRLSGQMLLWTQTDC